MDVTAALRALVRTIERGSITAAARDMGVSQPAVSKLIRNLENYTGARLLERSSRAVKPTSIGLALYEASGTSLARIDAALEAARREMGEVKGTLRLHGPVCLGESHISGIVADFQRMHHRVSVELTLENRSVDLVHENLDVAVRIGRPTEQNYMIRKIGLIERILVAAPAYLERRAAIRSPSALAGHDIIVTDAVLSRQGTITLVKGGRSTAVSVDPVLKTNNARVLISALLAGRGLGPVQVPLILDELATDKLARVLPGYEVKPSELYIVYPTSRFLRPAVRSFIEFAAPALRAIKGVSTNANKNG